MQLTFNPVYVSITLLHSLSELSFSILVTFTFRYMHIIKMTIELKSKDRKFVEVL